MKLSAGEQPTVRRRWLRHLLFWPLLATLGTSLLLLDASPLVARSESIAPESIAEAKSLFKRNDPRRLQNGETRTAEIPAPLIDEGVNYFASRHLHGRGAFIMTEDSAELRLTRRLPLGPLAAYLNVRASIREAAGEPRIASASVGKLPVPTPAAEWLLEALLNRFGAAEQWRDARRAIREIRFEPTSGRVGVTYVWERGLLERARTLALTSAEIVDIKTAHDALVALLGQHAPGSKLPLTDVLPPLLNAVDSKVPLRRAALLVLASYLAEKNLALLIPAARQWPSARWQRLTLQQRYDSAQHFVVSAALAAWAGEPAANAIGLYKEIDDARRGSGFSFADLAADRAGTRFGELIVENSPRLATVLRGKVSDDDLLPTLQALPEGYSADEFTAVFGNRDSPAYQRLLAEIERRLDGLPLYR